MKHYLNLSYEHKAAVEFTNLPGCLDRLRDVCVNTSIIIFAQYFPNHLLFFSSFQILIAEDKLIFESDRSTEVGTCMEYLLKHKLLDLLVSLAISDEPPGMKSCILKFLSKTLTQLNEPNVAHSSIYIPLMVSMCYRVCS